MTVELLVIFHQLVQIGPPGIPYIQARGTESREYLRELRMRDGDLLELTCTASEGNPVQPLVWKLNGHPIQGNRLPSGNHAANSGILISVLNFSASPSYHLAIITCEAMNLAAVAPKNDSIRVSVECIFPLYAVRLS